MSEPVAWVYINDDGEQEDFEWSPFCPMDGFVPLYDAKAIEVKDAAIAELVGVLGYVLGTNRDDEKIGWRGHINDGRLLRCEFCAKSHEDCTIIEHLDDCPVTVARAAIAKYDNKGAA